MIENFNHVPVMLQEVLAGLNINPDGVYFDGTLGGGGHSLEIVKRLTTGHLIASDRDEEAIEKSKDTLKDYLDKVEIYHDNYVNAKDFIGDTSLSGALLDLGVSSYQLDNASRGFSYMQDGNLDMRMNPKDSLSAYDVVNTYDFERLNKIIDEWGEEKFHSRIANAIIDYRQNKKIETTLEFAEIVRGAIPNWNNDPHPEKRTFQAIRIEVNDELTNIPAALENIIDCLGSHGRLCVITFHSLEDRIVKQTFAKAAKGCTCPPEIPVCVCGKKPQGKVITKKPVLPSEEECKTNSRSKSAKLRIFEKN